MNHRSKFNELLRKIRKFKGEKQIEIARETGLSKQMVSKMESVEGNPTLESLLLYCYSLGIDLVAVLEKEVERCVV